MYCLGVFFFFKQKTAYEMRISDWSSDVCSSDLRQRDLRADPADLQQVAEQHALTLMQEAVQRDAVFLHRMMDEQDHFLAGPVPVDHRSRSEAVPQIVEDRKSVV